MEILLVDQGKQSLKSLTILNLYEDTNLSLGTL